VTIDGKGAIPAFAVLTVGAAGVFGVVGPIASWVVTLVHGFAREVAFALFNALGGIGAFAGPTIIGKLSNHGNWRSSMYFMGGLCLLSAFMALGRLLVRGPHRNPLTVGARSHLSTLWLGMPQTLYRDTSPLTTLLAACMALKGEQQVLTRSSVLGSREDLV